VLVLCLGVAGVRYVQCLPNGGFRYERSPDGKYTAYAANLVRDKFWGGREIDYEFRVEAEGGRIVRVDQIPQPASGAIQFRGGPGDIFWSADSKSVSCGDGKTVLWSTTVP
jgi:hypothetical protein